MSDDPVKRTCLKCLGTKFVQVKKKPGKSWVNEICRRCKGTGKI